MTAKSKVMSFRTTDDVEIKVEELSRKSGQSVSVVLFRLVNAGYLVEKAKYDRIGQILDNLNY